MVAGRKDVAFQAMDGVLLKGWFFPAGEGKAPCVILTCGLTALKEHFVDDFAVAFQKAGYHALLYDNRGFGASGGKRFDADPVAAQDDYFDAFDYATSLPEVDADRIAYWGTSYSGGVAMTAAAIDKRIKAVVVQAPFVSGELQLETHMQFLPSALRDRGLIRTGEEWPITGIVANSLEEAQSGQAKVVLPDTIAYQYFQDSSERGGDWQNKMTTMTLIKMLRFEPIKFIHRIAPTPLLYVIGDRDVSVLASHQLQAFELAREPKQLHVLKGCGHFDPYRHQFFEENIKVQLEFLTRHL